MFDYGSMPALALSPPAPLGPEPGVGAEQFPLSTRVQTVDTVQALQSRINALQRTTLDSRLKPTHEALADLLPDGGLKEGAAYSVSPSNTLVMALLSGPSAAGSWCGVIGMPEFGIEAAEAVGIDLDRLVLVPHPGDQWLTVTASIADALSVVVVRPGRAAGDAAVARLSSRLRERGATLLVMGAWPQTEAMISLTESRWSGLGTGSGYLTSREVTVTVTSRRASRPVSGRLLMPDSEQGIRRLDPRIGSRVGEPRSAADRAQATWREVG
jgi:hypothetical protein